MKIGIIGDTHFGAGFNLGRTDPDTQLNSRLLDFSRTFNSIIDRFAEQGVKVVIITGDVFETRHPTSAQLNVFSRCINRAVSNGMKLLVVVGNHDQQRTIATTTVDIYGLLPLDSIDVFTEMSVYKMADENGEDVNFIFLPYRDRKMLDASSNADAIQKIQNKLNTLSYGLSGKKIAIGHFMIDKAISGQDGEAFSMSEVVIPSSIFSDMDLVIMGHVHQHAILKRKDPMVMYIGSMEKISFGERTHTKVSAIIDTDNIHSPEIFKSDIRSLHEMNFDYTDGDKYYKHQITDKIILDIEKFNMRFSLKGAIVKLIAKVKENDLYYVNHTRIREYILSKKVKYLMPLMTPTISSRKLRNKSITENVSGKKAMTSFINSLSEPDNVKKKLLKFASNIIEEVEGK